MFCTKLSNRLMVLVQLLSLSLSLSFYRWTIYAYFHAHCHMHTMPIIPIYLLHVIRIHEVKKKILFSSVQLGLLQTVCERSTLNQTQVTFFFMTSWKVLFRPDV